MTVLFCPVLFWPSVSVAVASETVKSGSETEMFNCYTNRNIDSQSRIQRQNTCHLAGMLEAKAAVTADKSFGCALLQRLLRSVVCNPGVITVMTPTA